MAKREGVAELPRELAAGGVSCAVASALFNPMDVVKIRIQAQAQGGALAERMYQSTGHAVRRILAEEGLAGLWLPGLPASMTRELTYSSLRMGLYPLCRNTIAAARGKDDGADAGLASKLLAGMTSGATGSALANPTDLVKIRQQGEAGVLGPDGKYTTGLRTGHAPLYRNFVHGFTSMYKHEGGIRAMYKGVGPTMVRAALLTGGQLATYDHTKHVLRDRGMSDGVPLHIIASLVAGVVATTFCAPADLVKTRVMTDRTSGKERRYSGAIDCLVKVVRNEGPLALFRGWTPAYGRLGPHFIVSLPLLEQCRRMFGLGYMT